MRLTKAMLVVATAATAACAARADGGPTAARPSVTASPPVATFCQDPFRGEDVAGDGAAWRVPSDATDVVAVEYDGLNAKPCRTVTARVGGGRELAALVARLNALPELPRRLTSCPSDDARAVTLTFTAPGGVTVVRVHGQGCRLATSPSGATRRGNDALYAHLVALVAAHRVP
ncbi:MAG TPA: hypothetical protein VGX28_15235 [Frankiaceae bacterium]|nr:hypothetical protein [Frankiaceae bacterium]